jgi:antitoxin (DNA-binding transcriptional repressor) of toxin-antitoxin stability system
MSEYKIEKANIARVKERLSAYVTMAEQGKTVLVCRRNKPVAQIVGTKGASVPNRTKLGSAQGSVLVKCDLTDPAIDETDWNALR